jgi:hypothetical protein
MRALLGLGADLIPVSPLIPAIRFTQRSYMKPDDFRNDEQTERDNGTP